MIRSWRLREIAVAAWRPRPQPHHLAGNAPSHPGPKSRPLSAPPPPRPQPQSHLLQLVLYLSPPGGRLLRRDHPCDPGLTLPVFCLRERALSASVPATPTSALGPAPKRAGGAMLGVAGGSVPARSPVTGRGR